MTDEELIAWLRGWGIHSADIAADRIEALIEVKDGWRAECLKGDGELKSAETKLAKAVEALRYVVSVKGLTDPTGHGYDAIKHARIVLAQIGETE